MKELNTSDSDSPAGQTMSKPFAYTLTSAFIIITIVTILGNLLVCYAILANRMLRRTPTNIFIFSLALSDLLTAVMAITFDIDILLKGGIWTHGEHMCRAWSTIYLIGVPTSILTLLAVSIDRYKTLSDPLGKFRETRFMTRKRAFIIVVCVWVYCVMFALVPVFGWREWDTWVHAGVCYFVLTFEFSVLSSFLNFIVPLLATCAVYIKIYLIARNRHDMFHESSSHSVSQAENERRHKNYRKNVRAAKTISLIIGAFFFCWVPYCVLSIVLNLRHDLIATTPTEITFILLMCGYLNCALNPFLYSLLNKRFKTTYTKICRNLRSKVRGNTTSSNVSLQTLSTRQIRQTELRDGHATSSNYSSEGKQII